MDIVAAHGDLRVSGWQDFRRYSPLQSVVALRLRAILAFIWVELGLLASWLARACFEHMCDGNSASMTNDTQQAPMENAEKDTSDWVTGDEPMTGPQRSYLGTLAQEAGRDIPDDLTKAQASELIDELQQQTGRSGSS